MTLTTEQCMQLHRDLETVPRTPAVNALRRQLLQYLGAMIPRTEFDGIVGAEPHDATPQSRAEQVEAEVSTVEPSPIAWDDIEPYTTYRCDDGLVVHVGAKDELNWNCASLIQDGTGTITTWDSMEHPFVKKLGVLRFISESNRPMRNVSFESLRDNPAYHPGEIK